MAARLLLHLLALDAATQAGFCWIDEPLEHLDPDTRRQVASLLAVTPSTSGVGQILVTTYEEPLVRRIARRMPEHARLVYVRAGPGSGA
jgi:DNA repair exonuclease SbcCD ATPase subunit